LQNAVRANAETLLERWPTDSVRRAACLGVQNLAQYLALRQRDLRDLQRDLTSYGLSSLGRSEARVMPSLTALRATVGRIAGVKEPPAYPRSQQLFRGERLLKRHTTAIFGEISGSRTVRVMVTMPTEAADDPAFVLALAQNGMDCVRINCSHDGPEVWGAIVEHVHAARRATGKPLRILMDLGGPKPRTADRIAPKKTRLQAGDTLLLTRDVPHKDERFPFQARCALPEVIDQLALNRRVFLDDGQVGLVVEALLPEGALLRVQKTPVEGYKLKDEKGLNFPDTELVLSPLQPEDYAALDFVCNHADLVGYSFVQSAADVALLKQALAERMADPRKMGIIAKIETPRAVTNLPEIIVEAVATHPFGVMIARGDLAVELGFSRTAEMQEEIMWLCEAAHVPVIWATQVLESFVKTGLPSRGEMTDAAMSARAECVMLNKGPFVVDAVALLDGLLSRMEANQTKKTPQLRALGSWREPAK
jgi:pyruvate kinase